MTAVAEPAGRPLMAQAKLIFRVTGDIRMAATAVSECKRLLARSGLVTHLRRRSVIIQGKWHAVMEAVRQCSEIVARSGDVRIVTAIRPAGAPAVMAAALAEEPAETRAPAAISLTGQRLHSGAAKAKRHRMSVA